MKSISTARSFTTTKKFNINVTLYYDTISNGNANMALMRQKKALEAGNGGHK